MANWYYYNKSGEKVGPITVAVLKTLTQQGLIIRETIIENHTGRTALAGEVNGLTFPEATIPLDDFSLGELNFEYPAKEEVYGFKPEPEDFVLSEPENSFDIAPPPPQKKPVVSPPAQRPPQVSPPKIAPATGSLPPNKTNDSALPSVVPIQNTSDVLSLDDLRRRFVSARGKIKLTDEESAMLKSFVEKEKNRNHSRAWRCFGCLLLVCIAAVIVFFWMANAADKRHSERVDEERAKIKEELKQVESMYKASKKDLNFNATYELIQRESKIRQRETDLYHTIKREDISLIKPVLIFVLGLPFLFGTIFFEWKAKRCQLCMGARKRIGRTLLSSHTGTYIANEVVSETRNRHGEVIATTTAPVERSYTANAYRNDYRCKNCGHESSEMEYKQQ